MTIHEKFFHAFTMALGAGNVFGLIAVRSVTRWGTTRRITSGPNLHAEFDESETVEYILK